MKKNETTDKNVKVEEKNVKVEIDKVRKQIRTGVQGGISTAWRSQEA